MHNINQVLKSLVLGPVSALSLLLQAYIGAVFFILCVGIEKCLVFSGSEHTVDSLLAEANAYYANKMQQYKQLYTQMEQQHFRIDWFK